MTPDAVEDRILAILARVAPRAADRAVLLKSPLGNGGLGLDSLAVVELVTSTEAAFEVEFPDEFWIGSGPVKLRQMVDYVRSRPAQ